MVIRAERPPVVLVLRPPIGRADIPSWCERLATVIQDTDALVVICDLAAFVQVDAVLVETLARLQLTALRLGSGIQLYRASRALTGLLALTGLQQIIQERSRSGFQPRWQAEEREERLGVEERVEPDDLAG